MTATHEERKATEPRADAAPTADLGRVLKPRSIAIVGLSDTSPFVEYIRPTLASDAEILYVNPKYDSVFGQPTYPSLSAVDRPVDVVMSTMAAERTTALVEEAADLDIGGMVLIAGGFAETSEEGGALQQRISDAAQRAGMAVVGPNGLGYVNVPHKVSLTIASPHKRRPGGISVVSQSGAMLSGVAMAAWDRPGVGLNLLISAGNEAVTDLADYVSYFADDPETRAIGLVIEKIRRPEAFFAAVRKAHAANKPVVTLKLARNPRSQKLAASHTGALTGDAWVYDVAFGQAGIGIAHDPEELVDRLALFEQIAPQRWSPAEKVGVVTMTGGYASLSVDLAAEEGVVLPPLDGFADWISSNLPGVTVPNPLDATGLGGKIWPDIVHKYSTSDELDTLVYFHPLADEDARSADAMVGTFLDAAPQTSKPFVVSNCASAPGGFAVERVAASTSAGIGHGLRSTMRGLAAMGEFVRHRRAAADEPAVVARVPRPDGPTVQVPEGSMLSFASSMETLRAAGIPIAPYHLIAGSDVPEPPFPGPYVAKLADVGHRTEYGAVLVNVESAELPDTVARLRSIAAEHGFPDVVAVQPMVEVVGELFLGIQGSSELGSMVVLGLGGVFVEVMRKVGGRMAPVNRAQAHGLIEEFADVKVLHGFRGQPAWDLDALADIVTRAGDLAVGGRDWISSIDVNPLVCTPQGFVAVDALCLVNA